MSKQNAKKHKKSQSHAHAPKKSHAPARIRPEEITACANKIETFLRQTGKKALPEAELARKCRSNRCPAAFQAALEQLTKQGTIHATRKGYALCLRSGCFRAETIRLSRSFGFIRDEAGTEHFVPGKFLQGSMPGDIVLARPIPSRTGGDSPEAEVVSVLEENNSVQLAGTIVPEEGGFCLLPDTMSSTPLRIDYKESVDYGIGDKVLAVLTSRGRRHMEHRVKILLNFGTADSAENCVKARIAAQGIPTVFPDDVLHEAKKTAAVGVTAYDTAERLDLREACIFTIDGAYSKDLDDAVSVSRLPDGGWELGVHIADVSHYVRPNSKLDGEAFQRGTSIYYADQVIPMLPPALSNGICSLNGGEDRLALSAVMQISPEGDLLSAKFSKSVIRSVVRGVYSECNAILDGTADAGLQEKYAPVADALRELDALTERLEHRRIQRGAPTLESTEVALLLDEQGRCTGLLPRVQGRSECIIEACMLAANEAAAKLAREAEMPLVYRVHEDPSPERIAGLKDMLRKLGQEPPLFEEASPRDIQKILDDARDKPFFPVVNNLALRAMAKAKYSHEPLGHFGLALRDYAHFTSPIRRYPDLVVHRILSDYLEGGSREWMQRRYEKFAENAAAHASDMEVRAVNLERDADDIYAAEYMRAHIGETFRGVISSVTDFGVYVTLENLAEGLLHIHDLPEGQYEIEEGWYLRESYSGQEYRLGDAIEVVCAGADVSAGKIDLALPE
ncbi:MAG: ribonuclease R [Oscillospiraceae bacterium]|nr:ribonuclease R [Oscillospiraceae bacterium]